MNTVPWVMIIVMTLLSIKELPSLWRTKRRKEWIFLLSTLLIGDAVAILYTMNFVTLNPMDGLLLIFQPVNDWITRLLS